ncbi:MAG: hypothetical protein OEV95_01640 [Gemmatimonadota bacterium]|nr:hypothetical protein [Gemmatimonadota bacterium]MDH5282322.1 hypothetical protein [Gemmatimonadota bacterium]
MKVPQLIALAATLAGAVPVRAQMVVQPEPKLDSTQQVIHSILYSLRDSLQYVDAASARLARDRDMTSDAVLRSRALTMAERCESVVRVTAEVKEVVIRSARPDPDPKGDRPFYLGAVDTLRRRMQDCAAEFTRLAKPESAQELRDYGIGKGQRVQDAIRTYHPQITRYFHSATGRRYQPYLRGAGATPTGN